MRLRAFLIAVTVVIPLAELQLACSGQRPANDHLQICWCELSAHTIFAGTHHRYAPGALPLRDGSLLVTCEDFATGGHRSFRGIIAP